jgi:hypothetical protein
MIVTKYMFLKWQWIIHIKWEWVFNVGVIYFSKLFFLTFIYASEGKAVLVSYKKTRYVAHTVKSRENLVIKTKKNPFPFYVNYPLPQHVMLVKSILFCIQKVLS